MAGSKTELYHLTLLGPWDLRGPDGRRVSSVLSQPKRLCLFAYLALRGEPVARSTLVALFWPEKDEEKARNALAQAVHYLRRSTTKGAVRGVDGDRLHVSPDIVRFDAREFLVAVNVTTSDWAADGNDFFEGWNAEDSQPLQDWLDGVRRRVREKQEELDRIGIRDAAVAATGAGTAGEISTGVQVGANKGGRFAAGPRSRRWLTLFGQFGGVATIFAAAAFGFGRLQNAAGAADMGNGEPIVAVLMPRLTTTGIAPPLSPEDVHDELVVALEAIGGVRKVASIRSAESTAELVRSRQLLGASDMPAWAMTVSIRVGGGQARVIGLLLRGPDYAEIEAGGEWTYTVGTDEQVLLDLPRQIAADAVTEFERWLREADPR